MNRVLVGVSFLAVALLGPAFTLGYMSGYRAIRPAGPQAEPGAAQGAPSQPVQAVETAQQKSAGPGRNQKPVPADRSDQPGAGQVFLQLAATTKDPSAAMIGVLRNHGFAAIASEVPEKPGIYRVLIGPLHENELDKTRANLQDKGFPGKSAIKRTF